MVPDSASRLLNQALAASNHWKYSHWNYPEGNVAAGNTTDPTELAPCNEWIKKYRLGHDLRQIAERGLSLKEGTALDIRTQDGEPPQTAEIGVHDLLDDASKSEPEIERFRELKFSPSPCSTCNGGMNPWHLWAYREVPVLKTPESHVASFSKSFLHIFSDAKRADHRVPLLAEPNATADLLMLFSIFTSDVENNSLDCPFGAYYSNGAARMVGISVEFVRMDKDYAVVEIHTKATSQLAYIERRLIKE